MHVSVSVDTVPRYRGTFIRGYVLSGHCSGQQISVKNEGYLFSEGYLFTGFYGMFQQFETVQNETFQSIPEVSGTCRSSLDVKSISSITREDFSNVYKCSGLQTLFVAVIYTSVDLLCKNSYESSSLLGYFDCFQSNHTVGCCNINFRSLGQIKREKNCFVSSVSIFLLYFLLDCSRFVATFGQLFTLRPPNFLF